MPEVFRYARDGQPVFYELWALREVEGTLRIWLALRGPDGALREEPFTLTRRPLRP